MFGGRNKGHRSSQANRAQPRCRVHSNKQEPDGYKNAPPPKNSPDSGTFALRREIRNGPCLVGEVGRGGYEVLGAKSEGVGCR